MYKTQLKEQTCINTVTNTHANCMPGSAETSNAWTQAYRVVSEALSHQVRSTSVTDNMTF